MKQGLKVEVLPGKHSRPAPVGTGAVFEDLLKKSGIKKGFLKVLLGKQIRGACGAKKVLIHNIDEQTGTILIKAQINGKRDQRFEFFLTLPNQFKQKPEAFLGALEKGAELINNPIESTMPNCEGEKELNNQERKRPEEPKIRQKRGPRGIGFSHFMADDEALYLFWLEIKDFFKNDEGVSRRELTEKFLSDYGHMTSCYRFIAKLLRLRIFAETPVIKGSRRLVIGERLKKIILKMESQSAPSIEKEPDLILEEIKNLQKKIWGKKRIEDLIRKKTAQIQTLETELADLKRWVSDPETQQLEEKMETLLKSLIK